MLNQVQLIGRLGKDIESRTIGSGSVVMNFSIATRERWRDKDSGEMKERIEWHRIVMWPPHGLIDMLHERGKKGVLVFIQGKLQTRKWTDQAGIEKYTTETVIDRMGAIRFLEKKGGVCEERDEIDAGDRRTASDASKQSGQDLDDEIPL